jgi:hypothetical protein
LHAFCATTSEAAARPAAADAPDGAPELDLETFWRGDGASV